MSEGAVFCSTNGPRTPRIVIKVAPAEKHDTEAAAMDAQNRTCGAGSNLDAVMTAMATFH